MDYISVLIIYTIPTHFNSKGESTGYQHFVFDNLILNVVMMTNTSKYILLLRYLKNGVMLRFLYPIA